MKNAELFNIIAIVNEGFSDLVMDVARDNGAQGGTIISANGSVSPEAEKLYGISIQPQKEIVLILVSSHITQNILDKLHAKAGTGTEASGVFFALPVSHASENLLRQYDNEEN